ncbi:MAG: helix-turn-helix domain-containing protein [Microlunatus sp.]|nr:helix-turn-helix domain-containing protein [Microlunatus sp.]
MADSEPEAGDIARLTALADPVRRRLYDYVAGSPGPVRREDAAQAAGISRTLAAYHLDRLADAGLLATSYARPGGRGGPGAGRPAKHYHPVQDELVLTVPPRSYGLLAKLLADAIAADRTGRVVSAVLQSATEEGRADAADGADLMTSLRQRGYDPVLNRDGDIELQNCPFHQLARRQTDLVCGLNQALIAGCLSGRGEDPGRAELRPQPGHCCVVIHPAA